MLLPKPPLVPNPPVVVPAPNDEVPKPVVAGFAPNNPPPVPPLDPKVLVALGVDPNPPEDPKVEVAVLFCCGWPKAEVVPEPNRPKQSQTELRQRRQTCVCWWSWLAKS